MIVGILFFFFFVLFLLLTTVKFQLTDYDHVTMSFTTHQIYAQIPAFLQKAITEQKGKTVDEESKGYREIVKRLTPDVTQRIIETNLRSVFLYFDGKTDDIVVYVPRQELGIETSGDSASFTISLSQVGQGRFREQIQWLNGITQKLLLAWFVVIFALLGLLYLHYLLGEKKLKRTGKLLIGTGGIVILLSLFLRFYVNHLFNIVVMSAEPSQRLFGILVSAFMPQMINTWFIIGGVVVVLGIALLVIPMKLKKGALVRK
jgi:hypothetical protein